MVSLPLRSIQMEHEGAPRFFGLGKNLATSLVENNNITIFDFEEKFSIEKSKIWFEANWTSTFYYVAIYLAVIFGGKHLMKNRPRFELRGLLALWNFGLALFSIIGTCRVAPELFHVLNRNRGFHHSVCTSGYNDNKVLAFWAWIFAMSKVVELGDTVFIVLRKQPLIFLHWYHHITVLIYTWYSCIECIAPSRWYVTVNFMIHSFMYTYYGLRALRFRIPKPIAIAITSSQILQMVVGVAVNVHAFIVKQNGEECDVSYTNINLCFAMYSSYFILFSRFFYRAYIARAKRILEKKLSRQLSRQMSAKLLDGVNKTD